MYRLRPCRRILRCRDRAPSAVHREGTRLQAARARARALRRLHEGKLPAPQALSGMRPVGRDVRKPPSIGFDGRRFRFVRMRRNRRLLFIASRARHFLRPPMS
ncbi:hypothetical protein BURKHO8Y_210495 [Burkholderia sp. 8Y]|nr:hypothetical protein BURKHO8Y_210495 [Burkholderia sp. 8Y]